MDEICDEGSVRWTDCEMEGVRGGRNEILRECEVNGMRDGGNVK